MEDTTVLRAEKDRWDTISVGFGLAVTAVVIVFLAVRGEAAWPSSPMLLLGVGQVLAGVWGRAARVELEASGLRVHSRRNPIGRRVAWAEVVRLHEDPPGGPRHLRLDLASGRQAELPPLAGEGNRLVAEAFDRSKTHGGASL